ncbi:Ger(x)C family spore germination protein [Paenibacillus antri]|uniref:Ger(X)C family spore germination protein n=1 Tax=Paenibacillus antri TaxID=2582848 RepID=A0A5R9G6D5_9BACL|nr:Ger(x)C family spore germination protein [Paenibacillus antri]TLS48323.1 Ger(x)C family spore germination protein [Paenibacillus antri]
MRRIPICVAFALSFAMLTGCWDRREINDIAFVSASAVDLEEDGNIRVTVQFPLPGQMGGAGSSGGGGGTAGTKPWHTESAVGRTGREVTALQQQSLSRTLNYSHRRVLIFGQDLAKNGIAEVLDVMGRIPQNRMSAFLFVTKGRGEALLEVPPTMEKIPAELFREIVTLSYKRPVSVETTVNALLQEGIDPYLPFMMTKSKGEGKLKNKEASLSGVALFKDDKAAAFLTGDTARGMLYALNQAKQPVVTIPAPEGSGYLSLRITSYDVSVELLRSGATPTFRIALDGEMIASENGSDYRFSENASSIATLERAVDESMERIMRKAMAVAQEAGSDPIGLGMHLYRHRPADWRRLKSDWRSIYGRAEIEVVVRLRFQHPGTITYPIGIPEKELEP